MAKNPCAEMSTLSQAVMETSRCLTGQAPTEEQVSTLRCQDPRVWLSGPPGTGTSLMLQLKAREWLRQGHRVMMVSLWPASHAVTLCLHNKVKQEMTTQPDKLHLVLKITTDFHDVIVELQELRHHIQESQLMDKGIGDDLQPFNSSDFETNDDDDDGDDDMKDFEIVTSKSLKQEIPEEETKTEKLVMIYYEGDHEEDMIVDPLSEKEGKNDTTAFPECGDDLEFSILDPGKEQMTESTFVELDTSCKVFSKQPNIQESQDELEVLLLDPGNEQMIESEFGELSASFEDLNKQLRSQESSDLSELKDQHPFPGPKEAKDIQKLHVIVDEAPWFLDSFIRVLEAVLGKDGFVIWAATSLPCAQPSGFTCFELTRNLRCPPSVVREMMETPAYKLFRRVKYTSQDTSEDTGVLSVMPLPTDGPMVKRIQHQSHGVKDVWDCEQCGKEVATFLTHDLKIGNTAAGTSALSAASDSTLRYSDVLISGRLPALDTSMQEGQTHHMDFGRPTSHQFSFTADEHPLPGFLKGLDQNGVPFDLMVKGDDRSYHRLADPQSSDCVQVAEADMLKGLERAVVVVLGTVDFHATAPQYVDPLYDVMGCCTSQLITTGLNPGCHVQRHSF